MPLFCRVSYRGVFIDGYLSREELNMDNPLGTGGEVAMEFGKLIASMFSDTPYA